MYHQYPNISFFLREILKARWRLDKLGRILSYLLHFYCFGTIFYIFFLVAIFLFWNGSLVSFMKIGSLLDFSFLCLLVFYLLPWIRLTISLATGSQGFRSSCWRSHLRRCWSRGKRVWTYSLQTVNFAALWISNRQMILPMPSVNLMGPNLKEKESDLARIPSVTVKKAPLTVS